MDCGLPQPVRTCARSDDQPTRRAEALTSSSGADWCAAIVGLHDFFTRWFAGDLVDTAEAFGPFQSALANDFTIVSPHGDEHDREATLAMVRAAHGSADGGPHISISDCRLIHESPPFALVRYVEVQDWNDGRHTERLSTALLEADVTATDGVRWHAVHETWRPGSG